MLVFAVVLLALGGCAAAMRPDGPSLGAAPLRGFGVHVDQAIAPQVTMVHLTTCGSWGCHDQDVPLHVSGPTSPLPCVSRSTASDAACGIAHVPGPGPGFGYAPVPGLTWDPVTVTVSTPPGAPFAITAEVAVRPSAVCQQDAGRPGGSAASSASTACPGATPQAQLRIAADGTVSQGG